MLDHLMMLLSSDWFFPYWSTIGLRVEPTTAINIQLGCREIVKDFIANAQEYWNVTFSSERLQRTATQAAALANKFKIKGLIANFIAEPKKQEDNHKNARAYLALTARLSDAEFDQPNDPPLDPAVRRIVQEIYSEMEMHGHDFAEMCVKSRSSWDLYLRGLTPDDPTFLADFLIAEVLATQAFAHFFSELKRRLKSEQLDELVLWYRATAESVIGYDIGPPG